jgi:cell division protein FtsL
MSRGSLLGLLLLYVLVVGMSLLIVANRHHSRELFAELQRLEKERDELSADWSRLKLEQSTLLNQVHVETRSKEVLKMQKPTADNIKVIHE